MALKSLVVFVDPSPAGEARVRYAVRLAMQHEAHLIGVFVVPPAWNSDPADCYIKGGAAIEEMVQRHSAIERAALRAAGERFEALAGRESYSVEFRVIRDGHDDDLARLHCLYTDLVVVGHPPPGGLPGRRTPERMMITTGIPFLIVPDGWRHDSVATNVVLAWNASREARRAITDSLPILQAAESVSVLIVDPEKNPHHGQEPGSDIAHFLSRHRVATHVERLSSQGKPVAQVILNYATANNSDLVVLGAYSHSRARELFFGGVTRSLLSAVTVPMLIAH